MIGFMPHSIVLKKKLYFHKVSYFLNIVHLPILTPGGIATLKVNTDELEIEYVVKSLKLRKDPGTDCLSAIYCKKCLPLLILFMMKGSQVPKEFYLAQL